jgi:tetratricopeptide (TPR) repeat protein
VKVSKKFVFLIVLATVIVGSTIIGLDRNLFTRITHYVRITMGIKSSLNIDPELRDRFRTLLKSEKFDLLDRIFSDFVKQFEVNEIDGSDLEYLLLGFQMIIPSFELKFERWVQKNDSWVSKMATAQYLTAMAWQWRGRAYWNKVPEENRANHRLLLEKAKLHLTSAFSRTDKDSLVYASLIDIANDSGDSNQLELIQTAFKRFPKSVAIYKSAIRATSEHWGGNRYSRQRLIHELDSFFSRGIKENSTGVLDYYNAHDAFMKKDFASSISDYINAIKKDPTSIEYHYALAKAYKQNDQHQKALESVDIVVEYWPSSNNAHKLRASLLATLEQHHAALEDIEYVLDNSPYDRDANLEAFSIYARLDDKKSAMKALVRATYFTKYDPGQWGRLGFNAQHDLKDSDIAADYYSKALELRPYDVIGAYGLATIYADRESCKIVKSLHDYLTGCVLNVGATSYQCAARYRNWAHSTVNHLMDHRRCTEINNYDFSQL